ncbi:MAG: helix-turn-helix transcriptional regulator [Bacilli bacterium]|nr:helix-turn-helix transcriptional regulator [Bacilli bacterium]
MKTTKLGSRIKDLRESRNMTQAELAKLLFVSDKTISKWEKGNSDPETEILVKISEIFDVTLDYLLTGETKIKDIQVVSRIELACREDNIALLEGVDLDAFDEYGKNLDFYAKQYQAKNVQDFLLNYKVDKYVERHKDDKKYHICGLMKGCNSEEDLVLLASGGSLNKIPEECAKLEKKGYHGFRVFREIGVNEKPDRDYQQFFCQCLDHNGFNKMQISIEALDDKQSGILTINIYRDKTYELNKRDDKGKLVPDYYPESSTESRFMRYVRPDVMNRFIKILNDIELKNWENRSWGCSIHDLFFVLKNQPKDNLGFHKFYVAPQRDLYRKFVKGIQQLCLDVLSPLQNKTFTNVFNGSDVPYFRAGLPFIKSMQIFINIDKEQEEIKKGEFDFGAQSDEFE